MYLFKSLDNISYKEITICFCNAFSDYDIPMKLTEEELKIRLELSGINKELSYGAFFHDEMVGFIFNSCQVYQGEPAVFDIGTAVVPEHRGKRVFYNLFHFSKEALLKNNVGTCYLEVLQQNERAVRLYKNLGFEIAREFSVLKAAEKKLPEAVKRKASCIEYTEYYKLDMSNCYCPVPSFEHSTGIIQRNPHLYQILYLENTNKITAFCVFEKERGSIVQFGYADQGDLSIIIENMLNQYKTITVKNIDLQETDLLHTLSSLGFEEVVKQFEMVKKLKN